MPINFVFVFCDTYKLSQCIVALHPLVSWRLGKNRLKIKFMKGKSFLLDKGIVPLGETPLIPPH